VVFASSIAVFGAPFPDKIGDEFLTAPLTSYGTQKAIGELLLADYTRRGFFDGIGLRCRPSASARAAEQGGVRLLLQHPARAAGRQGSGPAGVGGRDALVRQSARRRRLPHPRRDHGSWSGSAPGATVTMPGLAATVGEEIAGLRAIAGEKVVSLIRREPDPVIERSLPAGPRDFSPAGRSNSASGPNLVRRDQIITSSAAAHRCCSADRRRLLGGSPIRSPITARGAAWRRCSSSACRAPAIRPNATPAWWRSRPAPSLRRCRGAVARGA
jgi:hypothetical protein